VTGAIAAVLMVNHDVPWPAAILVTLLAGAAIGAWQGYWIAYFEIPAFIVTLAGMLVFRALTLTILGNQGIGPFPDEVRTIANGFLPGYLGNIGLGPLGAATLLSPLMSAVLVAGYVGIGWCNRQGRIRHGQQVEPPPVFAAKNALAVVVLVFTAVQLARFKNMP